MLSSTLNFIILSLILLRCSQLLWGCIKLTYAVNLSSPVSFCVCKTGYCLQSRLICFMQQHNSRDRWVSCSQVPCLRHYLLYHTYIYCSSAPTADEYNWTELLYCPTLVQLEMYCIMNIIRVLSRNFSLGENIYNVTACMLLYQCTDSITHNLQQ